MNQEQFVRDWWKGAQKQGTILTKPVRYRQLKERLEKDFVPKTQYDLLQFQYQQILQDVDYQLQTHTKQENETLKENLAEWEERYQGLETNLNQQAQAAKEQKKESKEQNQAEKQLYLTKINDLETAFFNLAKQKLAKKKEVQELVEKLEENWKNDRETWTQERAELEANHQAEKTLLKQTITNLTEQGEQKQTKINELTEGSQGQQTRIQELETNQQNLITQQQTNLQREKELGEQKLAEAKAVFDNYREQKEKELTEQKTFLESQIQAEKDQTWTHAQTITNLEAQLTSQEERNILLQQTNQTQQATLQAREATILNNRQRITQLETYLQTSQQDNQAKQQTINTLNQDKISLQTRITELTQANTEQTRLNGELNQTNTNLENELITERTDRRQAETEKNTLQTQLNEVNTKLAGQKTVLEQLLTNREPDSLPASGAGFCLWCHHRRRLVTNKQICHVCDSKIPVTAWAEQQELAEQEITLIKEALHD
jgi:hypothetical protein